MKKIVITSILSIFIWTGFVFAEQGEQKEVGEQFDKSRRFEEINRLRGGEDGINWQLIDRETRMSRLEKLNKMSIERKNNPTMQGSSFANGALTGRWVEKGSNNQAGRTRYADIDFEDGTIYCGTDGGNIFRGSLDGDTWTCLNNFIRVRSIKSVKLLKDQGKKRIFVAGGNGYCYYSEDDGATWNLSDGLEDIQNWGEIKRVEYSSDDKNTIWVLGQAWNYETSGVDVVLYKSVDKALTFEKVYSRTGNLRYYDIWAARYDVENAYMFRLDSLFSLDSGEPDFVRVLGSKNSSNPHETVQPSTSTILYYRGAYDGENVNFALMSRFSGRYYFFISYDEGASWTQTGMLENEGHIWKNPFMTNSFECSSYSASMMYNGAMELHISEDAGNSWRVRNKWGEYYSQPETKLHADIPAVQFFRDEDEKEIMLISTDGGLYISDDYLETVQNLSMKDLNCSQYYSSLTAGIDTNIIYAGAQDQGFQKSVKDNGTTVEFKQLISGDYGSISSSDGGESIWSVYPSFAMYIPDAKNAGKSPFYAYYPYQSSGWPWMTPVKAVPGDPQRAYACGGRHEGTYRLWHFRYADSKIEATPLSQEFSDLLMDLAYDGEGNILLVKGKGNSSSPGMLVKTDKGSSWESTVIAETFVPTSIVVDPSNQNTVYTAGRAYNDDGAYASRDGGETFFAISDGLPNTHVSHLAISNDGEMVFAATSAGPYVFLVDRNKWYDLTTDESPDQDFRWVEWVESSKLARFSTYGRGIWDFRVENFIAGIEDGTESPDYQVAVSPNPMSVSTEISFDIPETMQGKVEIFDLAGNKIACVYEGTFRKGKNKFTWDGTDFGGNNLPTGTYYCLATVEGYTAFTKIVIGR